MSKYLQYDASGSLVSMGEWSFENSARRFGSNSQLENSKLEHFSSKSKLENFGSDSKVDNVTSKIPKGFVPSGVYYLHTR